MLAMLIANLAYFLAIGLDLMALILILEWLFHLVPGWQLNNIRRFFFGLSLPLLKLGEAYFPLRIGSFDFTAFFMAVLLLAVSCFGIPWLVLLSFSLRG
jgi:hypothetical protein